MSKEENQSEEEDADDEYDYSPEDQEGKPCKRKCDIREEKWEIKKRRLDSGGGGVYFDAGSASAKREAKTEFVHKRKEKTITTWKSNSIEGIKNGYKTDHQDYCEVCLEGDEIILCDTCPRVYHSDCLHPPELKEVPEGKWSCPHCVEEGVQKTEEVHEHEKFCWVCKDDFALLVCDSCPLVYHSYCLDPPLLTIPDGDWKCPHCSVELLPGKVARDVTTEEGEEVGTEVIKQEAENVDSAFWVNLLGRHLEQQQEDISQTLGEGKRVLKPINYNDGGFVDLSEDTTLLGNLSDYYSSNSSTSSDDQRENDEYDENLSRPHGELKLKRLEEKHRLLPPLLVHVGGEIEILGFNGKQRKAFLKAIMKYGMLAVAAAAEDSLNSQWLVRDLRGKSKKDFKAYVSLFMRHLSECGNVHAETFADRVLRGGLTRQDVMTRMGVISLIRKKVQEFEQINGHYSIPELICPIDLVKTNATANAPVGIEEEKGPRKFMFDIVDGGFTELHRLWNSEENAVTPGREYEFWHRRHDFWLLAGIVQHGYSRWRDIQNDLRFAIINAPFRMDIRRKINYLERKEFLAKRFKFLEKALVIEEQLRRAAYLHLTQDPNDPTMSLNAPTTEVECNEIINELGKLQSNTKLDVSELPTMLAPIPKNIQQLQQFILSHLTDTTSSTTVPSGGNQTIGIGNQYPCSIEGNGQLKSDVSFVLPIALAPKSRVAQLRMSARSLPRSAPTTSSTTVPSRGTETIGIGDQFSNNIRSNRQLESNVSRLPTRHARKSTNPKRLQMSKRSSLPRIWHSLGS